MVVSLIRIYSSQFFLLKFPSAQRVHICFNQKYLLDGVYALLVRKGHKRRGEDCLSRLKRCTYS